MKKILFLVYVLATLAFTVVIEGSTSVLITPSSKLLIKGKTNINTFKCQFDILKLKKPIPVFFKKINDKMVFENTTLVLENDCFDCGGKGINNDFQELLKSELYPKTYINLKEISIDDNNPSCVFASINIHMAGATKSYTIPVELNQKENLHIKGILNLDICDFNLEPPKKALGLVVVKNMIEINFDLMVKEYEN